LGAYFVGPTSGTDTSYMANICADWCPDAASLPPSASVTPLRVRSWNLNGSIPSAATALATARSHAELKAVLLSMLVVHQPHGADFARKLERTVKRFAQPRCPINCLTLWALAPNGFQSLILDVLTQ
jgi:hypothetical protein